MYSSRTYAAIAGGLFFVGTATGTIAALIKKPILDGADYLISVSANASPILLSAFLLFLMGIACAGIGMVLYPLVKPYGSGVAIGVVGFRLAEGMFTILGARSTINLLALSQEFVKTGAPDGSYFQAAGAVLKTSDAWLTNGANLICWCIGALLYYAVFYQQRLIPRWITVWGLAGVSLTIAAAALVMFNVIPAFGTVQMLANLPIMPQELVFAAWLIARGVKLSAAESPSTQTVTA